MPNIRVPLSTPLYVDEAVPRPFSPAWERYFQQVATPQITPAPAPGPAPAPAPVPSLVPVSSGGTGLTNIPAGGVPFGRGTLPMGVAAFGNQGDVLTVDNGTVKFIPPADEVAKVDLMNIYLLSSGS